MTRIFTQTCCDVIIVDAEPADYQDLALPDDQPPLRVLFARKGNEALCLPRPSEHGLWMVNVDLPDMSGFELLELVRQRQPRVAFCLVGDGHSLAEELAARAAGATAYLCKPLRPTWLREWRAAARGGLAAHPSPRQATGTRRAM